MRLIVLVLALFISQASFAQHSSFSLYPVKPLLINPAFAGVHGRSEVSLNYRQQWLGLEDAPSVATFQFDRALTPQISLGIQAQQVSQGALSSNRANALFAYRVLLGEKTSLNFGLAGGILSHGLSSQSTYNPADPAIQNLPIGEVKPDLKFGTNYHFRGFNLGITFTEMIANRATESMLSDDGDSNFYENYIVNFDYKFKAKSYPLALQPFLLYYQDKDLSDYVEGGALLHYDKLAYLGGSYRVGYGAGVIAGLNIKDFQLAYGYEIAPSMVNGIGQGSHEIQLSFRFGKMVEPPSSSNPPNSDPPIIVENTRDQTEDTPVTAPTEKEREATSKQEAATEAVSQVDPEEEEYEAAEVTEAPEPQHAIYYSGEHANEMAVGFYVIAGAFTDLNNAQRNASILSKEGVFAGTGYNSERKVFFVYVFRSDNLEKTREARDNFRKKATLKDAWLLEIR
jgi:type IX secretion system PorP/SprF family membrane protein